MNDRRNGNDAKDTIKISKNKRKIVNNERSVGSRNLGVNTRIKRKIKKGRTRRNKIKKRVKNKIKEGKYRDNRKLQNKYDSDKRDEKVTNFENRTEDTFKYNKIIKQSKYIN